MIKVLPKVLPQVPQQKKQYSPVLIQQSTNQVPGSGFRANLSPGLEDQLQPQHIFMAETWMSHGFNSVKSEVCGKTMVKPACWIL